VKHRATREFAIGGVIGPITRPEVVIAGLYRGDDLVIVGRTVPLSPAQSAALAAVLTPAKPGHPWPDEVTSQRWGGKDSKKPLSEVEPLVVATVWRVKTASTRLGQGPCVGHGLPSSSAPTGRRSHGRPVCQLVEQLGRARTSAKRRPAGLTRLCTSLMSQGRSGEPLGGGHRVAGGRGRSGAAAGRQVDDLPVEGFDEVAAT
jgi:hypothetical protein